MYLVLNQLHIKTTLRKAVSEDANNIIPIKVRFGK
jgi:hypothetical protein